MGVLRGRTWTNSRQRGGSKPVGETPLLPVLRHRQMEQAASPVAGECLEVVENADGRWNVAVVVAVVVMGRGGTERNVTTPNCLIPGRAMRELIGNTDARGCVHGRVAGRVSIPLAYARTDTQTARYLVPLSRERTMADLGFISSAI